MEVHVLPVVHRVDHRAAPRPACAAACAASSLNRLTPSGTTHRLASSGYWSSTPGQRVVEHRAVVHAGAHDDLAVHLDAVVEQRPQPAQARGAPPVAQHVGPHVGIGGVDADVQRRQPLGDDSLEVGLGEAGERREVPVEERQPVVVVLQVERSPQARRQLVDEAELAVVVAGADLVEQRRVDLDAERLARLLVHVERQRLVLAADPHRHLGLVDQQVVVDDVAGLLTVELDQLVARFDTRARRR